MKTKLNLSGYTRPELAFIIRHMVDSQGNDHQFRNAILDLKFQREIDLLDEEDELYEAILEKRRVASELMAPYKESGPNKAPLEVQQRYAALTVEAMQLEKKYQAITKTRR